MSSPPSASSSPAAASRAFDLLAEPVRRWVYDQGWQTLRDAQEAAIPVLLDGHRGRDHRGRDRRREDRGGLPADLLAARQPTRARRRESRSSTWRP